MSRICHAPESVALARTANGWFDVGTAGTRRPPPHHPLPGLSTAATPPPAPLDRDLLGAVALRGVDGVLGVQDDLARCLFDALEGGGFAVDQGDLGLAVAGVRIAQGGRRVDLRCRYIE